MVQDFKKYHEYIRTSFEHHQSLMELNGYSWAPLKTVYIGGGTPSMWGVEGKEFLNNFFHEKNLVIDPECEFTLEVNPGAWTDESLSAWRIFGVNRFSLGIQSLNAGMINYLDRIHSIGDVFDTLNYFNKNQLNFSVDLMLGLPYSKELKRNIIEELAIVLGFNPSHFSVYILTVKENYKHYLMLPDEEWIEKEFLDVADFLCSKKFLHYEVSNFSLPEMQSRHNFNYWSSQTVAALGPSATGFFKENRLRYKWKPNYPEFETEQLTEEEFQLEKIYMSLRSSNGVRVSDFSKELLNVVNIWKERNLVHESEGVVRLNSKGYLLVDSLMNDLFKSKLI
jgi:oxygen-independent coproporphyrinogen-3 oxidase